MIEGDPVVIRVGVMGEGPPVHGDVLFLAGSDVPDERARLLAGGLLNDVPELGGPPEHTEVFVRPVVGRATHGVALVPGEIFVDRVRWVGSELGAYLGKFLEYPQVERWEG